LEVCLRAPSEVYKRVPLKTRGKAFSNLHSALEVAFGAVWEDALKGVLEGAFGSIWKGALKVCGSAPYIQWNALHIQPECASHSAKGAEGALG